MAKYTATATNPDGIRVWEEIHPVLAEFAQILKKDIAVTETDKFVEQPCTNQNILSIYIYCQPIATRLTQLDSAYNISLSGKGGEALQPSGSGTIITDPNGVAVAEVIDSTLYILFNLSHCRYNNVEQLIRHIMEDYIKLIGLSNPLQRVINIFHRLQKPQRKSYRVSLAYDGHMETWNKIEPVLSEFSQILMTDVVVSNPHGSSQDPSNNNNVLTIYFWSSPRSTTQKTTLERAYNIDLMQGRNGDAFEPSHVGQVITDPNGVAVAEVVDQTLYVLFDLPHGESFGGEEALMRHIMEDYVELVGLPNPLHRLLRKSKQIIPSHWHLQPNISSWPNFVEIYRIKRGKNKGMLEKNIPLIRADFKELKSQASGRIKVEKNKIHIPMGEITRQHSKRNIGEITLIINTDNYDVNYLASCISSATEWHSALFSSGEMCLGNISSGITQLIKEKEFAVVATAMRSFFESG